mmetsp:Transcript_14451/g.32763  ORF Transcript_14451/g.32763 Transcript_14451/m.32763 type:complete len:305 (-) Transcript_14451:383-1297(-)
MSFGPEIDNDPSTEDSSTSTVQEGGDDTPQVGPLARKVLWSCVARDGVIIVDAAEENIPFQKAVTKAANEIRDQPPGISEFSTCFFKPPKVALKGLKTPPLVGLKLTVTEYGEPEAFDEDDDDKKAVAAWDAHANRTIWSFCCVFNPAATSWKHPYPHVDRDMESFLKEINRISAPQREPRNSPWRISGWDGSTVQRDFGPILLGAMRDVGYIGRRDRVNQSVEDAKKSMNDNISHMLEENHVQAEKLLNTSDDLMYQTKVFKKKSKELKKDRQWKNRKMAMILGGTCATVGGAVAVPVVAVLL